MNAIAPETSALSLNDNQEFSAQNKTGNARLVNGKIATEGFFGRILQLVFKGGRNATVENFAKALQEKYPGITDLLKNEFSKASKCGLSSSKITQIIDAAETFSNNPMIAAKARLHGVIATKVQSNLEELCGKDDSLHNRIALHIEGQKLNLRARFLQNKLIDPKKTVTKQQVNELQVRDALKEELDHKFFGPRNEKAALENNPNNSTADKQDPGIFKKASQKVTAYIGSQRQTIIDQVIADMKANGVTFLGKKEGEEFLSGI